MLSLYIESYLLHSYIRSHSVNRWCIKCCIPVPLLASFIFYKLLLIWIGVNSSLPRFDFLSNIFKNLAETMDESIPWLKTNYHFKMIFLHRKFSLRIRIGDFILIENTFLRIALMHLLLRWITRFWKIFDQRTKSRVLSFSNFHLINNVLFTCDIRAHVNKCV